MAEHVGDSDGCWLLAVTCCLHPYVLAGGVGVDEKGGWWLSAQFFTNFRTDRPSTVCSCKR